MKRATKGQASMHIDAPPELEYDLVSDVTRMGEWSPETSRCKWLDGASGPAIGARFKGYNRRGRARWSMQARSSGPASSTAKAAGRRLSHFAPFGVRAW